MSAEEIRKQLLELAKTINPKLNPELFLPTPRDVLAAIERPPISEWLRYIAEEHTIPRRVKLLLLVPCTAYKPYSEARDLLYQRFHELRARLGERAYFVTVSVPLALEPEEHWDLQWRGYNLVYDCPFFPWIERYGLEWDEDAARKVIESLRKVVERWWERNRGRFEQSLAFIVPSSPDRALVEGLADEIVPDFDPPTAENPSYDNNASQIYCYPSVWKAFVDAIRRVLPDVEL